MSFSPSKLQHRFRNRIPGSWSVLLLLSIPLLIGGCSKSQGQYDKTSPATVENPVKESGLTTLTLTPEAAERLGIETVVVEYRRIRQTRTIGGEMMIPPGRAVIVSAPMAGILAAPQNSHPLAAGAKVTKGHLLFHLLVLPSGGDLMSTRQEVAEHEVRLKVARAKADRAEQLWKASIGTLQQYEEAQAELATVEAALKLAQNRLEVLSQSSFDPDDDKLTTLRIESPDDGILEKIHVAPGQTVASGAPLFEVASLHPLWVRVPVYAGDLASFDRARPVSVSSLGRATHITGRPVKPISAPPSADPLAASVDLYFEVENHDDAFRPGERVNAVLPMRGETESLVIPHSAVVYDIHGSAWVYEQTAPQVFVRRRIELTDVVDGYAVFSRGPAPGTSIVIKGSAELFGTEFGEGK